MSLRKQPNFPVLDWGIVIAPHDPDIVTHLEQQFLNDELSLEEFEKRLDEVAWI